MAASCAAAQATVPGGGSGSPWRLGPPVPPLPSPERQQATILSPQALTMATLGLAAFAWPSWGEKFNRQALKPQQGHVVGEER